NVLTAISGHALLAADAVAPDHPVQRNLQGIQRASERATDMVRRILTFSRQQEPRRAVIELQPVVEEVLKLFGATVPAAVEGQTRCEAGTPPVLADATQVHQVVMNLGTNAVHAMGERGGVLELRLETMTGDVAADLHGDRYVRLVVRDTGCGMDRATLDRI